MTRPFRTSLAGVAVAAGLALAACSADRQEPEPNDLQSDTVAQALSSQADLSTLSQAVVDAQLNEVLDGSGSYTILAPTDEAFAALGEPGRQLLAVERRPLLVGLLREHIVPGHLTPQAIGTAIDKQGGAVRMTTMGGGTVSFAREGEAITVARDEGKPVRFVGSASESGNGTVIPIAAVLTSAQPEAGGPADRATQ